MRKLPVASLDVLMQNTLAMNIITMLLVGLIGYTSSDVKMVGCKNNGNLIASNPLESKTADMFIGYICSNNCEIIYEN